MAKEVIFCVVFVVAVLNISTVAEKMGWKKEMVELLKNTEEIQEKMDELPKLAVNESQTSVKTVDEIFEEFSERQDSEIESLNSRENGIANFTEKTSQNQDTLNSSTDNSILDHSETDSFAASNKSGDGMILDSLNDTNSRLTGSSESNTETTNTTVPVIHPSLMEKEKNRYLEAVKEHLRTKLQLKTSEESLVPESWILPPTLRPLFLSMQADEYDSQKPQFYAKPNNAYIWASDDSRNCSSYFYACLGFRNLTALKGKGFVSSAKLWVYSVKPGSKTELKLYSLKRSRSPGGKTKVLKTHRLVGTVVLTDEGFAIDVTKAVRKWVEKSRNNHGFGLVSKHKIQKHLLINHQDMFSNVTTRPFIEVNLLPSKTVNKNPVCTPEETRCCRNKMTILASDLIPNIIAPESFDVSFCTGTCDDPTLTPANNYTRMMQSYVWRTENETLHQSVVQCCAPIAFRAESVLLYRRGSVIQYDIPDFMPTACGCV